MKHLKDITVLVLGLGESGLAMARWCAEQGSNVRVWDSRDSAPQDAALAAQVPTAQRVRGGLALDVLDGAQLVLKSPGLAPADERIAAVVDAAQKAGVPVQGELGLFAIALADLKAERGYAPKVLAITGTNGKTTTTAMTALLIERAGKRVAMAGNIGPTMLQTLADALALEPEVESVVPVEAPSPHPSPLPEGEGIEQLPLAEEEVEEFPPLPLGEGRGEGADVPQELPHDIHPESEGPPAHLIPPPPPGPVFEHLPEVWVLELSSFQLDEAEGFEPSAAAVLNLSQDHLDWHGTMDAYAAAKARIFGRGAVMVINRDDEQVEKMIPAASARPSIPQGERGSRIGKGRIAKPVERKVVRFGLDAPKHPGDFGLATEGGIAWLVRAMEADESIKKPRKGAAAAEPEDLHIQRLMPADAMRIRGRHNAANALAALSLATSIGCPLAPMLHGLREYAGEPHRVEFVANVHGIDAYDDSKGTNVGATVAAINGLGDDKAPAKLVVILGGDGKGQDFAPLATPVQRHARAVATIGRDAEAIEMALRYTGVTTQRHETLEAATRWAFGQAHSGDAVLLSPACASLDMFRNYAHRAEVFVTEVRALAETSGEVA